MTKDEALVVVREAMARVVNECPNGFAKAYAQAGLILPTEAIGIQILYVLNNTQHWRGPIAKATKEKLRQAYTVLK